MRPGYDNTGSSDYKETNKSFLGKQPKSSTAPAQFYRHNFDKALKTHHKKITFIMHFSSILAIITLGVSAAVATTANLFSNTYCEDDDYINNVNLRNGCHTLDDNVKAFDVRNIDAGCTGKPASLGQSPRKRGTYEGDR